MCEVWLLLFDLLGLFVCCGVLVCVFVSGDLMLFGVGVMFVC